MAAGVYGGKGDETKFECWVGARSSRAIAVGSLCFIQPKITAITIIMLMAIGNTLSRYYVLGIPLSSTQNLTYSSPLPPSHNWEMEHRGVKKLPKAAQLERNGATC